MLKMQVSNFHCFFRKFSCRSYFSEENQSLFLLLLLRFSLFFFFFLLSVMVLKGMFRKSSLFSLFRIPKTPGMHGLLICKFYFLINVNIAFVPPLVSCWHFNFTFVKSSFCILFVAHALFLNFLLFYLISSSIILQFISRSYTKFLVWRFFVLAVRSICCCFLFF